MEEYLVKCKKSDSTERDIHPTWCELCEKQTQAQIVALLKKHLHEPGEYTLYLRVVGKTVRRKKSQGFFCGWLSRNSKGNAVAAGPVCIDYFDDTFEKYDFVKEFPEIACEKEVINPSARFAVVGDNLFPSSKEFEIICEKSAERFEKRLHKSVDFPLEINCDYPDVIFEICYDTILDDSLAADTLKAIEEYAAKYNKRHDEGIHYVADASESIENKESNAVYVHVDFGECDIGALAGVLKAIGKSKLPIKKMTLK